MSGTTSETDPISSWWEDLAAAALIGTARRHAPPLPSVLGPGREGAAHEVALLDAAALGAAVRRAGAAAGERRGLEPAEDDVQPLAPPRAVHLLELLLHQSPVGKTLSPQLVGAWLRAAAAHHRRAPHHLLPALLDLATQHDDLRPATLRVGDARAAWLVRVNPAWAWPEGATSAVGSPAGVDPVEWAREPREDRRAVLAQVRAAEPAHGRALVESTWHTDAAADRSAHLAALRTGLGPDDEPLLERALDDRSAKVREVAADLLDALPRSARASRHAARLRPLLRVRGTLRKTLEVDLPVDPDDAGARDGLVRPTRTGSLRGWWLQRLAAGAPLEVWTDATRADPATTWRMLSQPDARAGIVEAVVSRRDPAWAAAVAADVWRPQLLRLLPRDQVDAVAARQLERATREQLPTVVDAVPTPWGPQLSRAVLARLTAEKSPEPLTRLLGVQLATGLDPATRPTLEAWRDRLEGTPRDHVTRICQYLALVAEIPEAFA